MEGSLFTGIDKYTDQNIFNDVAQPLSMSHGDQDIATLVKQRRFSTTDEWISYIVGIRVSGLNQDILKSVLEGV